jgi:hypothetical protein
MMNKKFTWGAPQIHGSAEGVDYPQNMAIPAGSAAAGTLKKFSYFPNLDVLRFAMIRRKIAGR